MRVGKNPQDVAARRLLEKLAEVNHLFQEHSTALRGLPEVSKAETGPLEAASYRNGPRLEGYVEAALRNGDVLCWCIDITWDQTSWTLEASLDEKSGDRQKTVKKLPTVTVNDFDSFLQALDRLVHELLALSITEAA